MRIPHVLKGVRYYVATDEDRAFASWPSVEEAADCVQRFFSAPDPFGDAESIRGILQVGPNGRLWVWEKESDDR